MALGAKRETEDAEDTRYERLLPYTRVGIRYVAASLIGLIASRESYRERRTRDAGHTGHGTRARRVGLPARDSEIKNPAPLIRTSPIICIVIMELAAREIAMPTVIDGIVNGRGSLRTISP